MDYSVCVIGLNISIRIGVLYAYTEGNTLYLFRYHRGDAKFRALSVAVQLLATNES